MDNQSKIHEFDIAAARRDILEKCRIATNGYDIVERCKKWNEFDLAMKDVTIDPKIALDSLTSFVIGAQSDPDYIKMTIDISIVLSALGHGRKVAEIITTNDRNKAVHPLYLGIRLYLGDKPIGHPIDLDIAADVAKRINQPRT